MADKKHLEILRQGVEVWNQWRQDNPDIKPNIYKEQLDFGEYNQIQFNSTILSFTSFRFTSFQHTNFDNTRLCNAILNDAELFKASLQNSNLTRLQALGTNFNGANLTGSCIEDWNINSKTNLQNVQCDYIYLRSSYSEKEGKWIFTDRRPHDPEQIFAPGEFTQLFQKALETVDLIFSEGIEWTAFLESFKQLQDEVKSEELSIQGIEKKSGAFIVRLEVPHQANKAEIEKYIKQEYDAKLKGIEASYQKQLRAKDETIQAYREKGTDLLKMAEIMSNFQQNTIINNNPNMTNQSGNFGIGQNNDNISGHSKVAGEINEAAPPDLAQDNIEIGDEL
ncbi:MAG: pentapeptide repeat-containing protein [Cyanobacteria bacterium P01_G01_bin.39]